MANIDTSQAITVAGLTPSYTNVTGGGDRLLYVEGGFIHVKNGAVASTTGTITPVGNTAYGAAKPAKTYTVGANSDLMLPMLPDHVDPADGRIPLAFSPTTTVSVAVLRK